MVLRRFNQELLRGARKNKVSTLRIGFPAFYGSTAIYVIEFNNVAVPSCPRNHFVFVYETERHDAGNRKPYGIRRQPNSTDSKREEHNPRSSYWVSETQDSYVIALHRRAAGEECNIKYSFAGVRARRQVTRPSIQISKNFCAARKEIAARHELATLLLSLKRTRRHLHVLRFKIFVIWVN